MISIIVGYVFLGYGSISLAPVLLVLGYCVLVPWHSSKASRANSSVG